MGVAEWGGMGERREGGGGNGKGAKPSFLQKREISPPPLCPQNHLSPLPIDPGSQRLDPDAEPLDDIADMPDLVELDLELVNLPQDIPEPGDLRVGDLQRRGGALRVRGRGMCGLGG